MQKEQNRIEEIIKEITNVNNGCYQINMDDVGIVVGYKNNSWWAELIICTGSIKFSNEYRTHKLIFGDGDSLELAIENLYKEWQDANIWLNTHTKKVT